MELAVGLVILLLIGLAVLGVVLTGMHLHNALRPSHARRPRGVELTIYLLGLPLTGLLLSILGWRKDWPEALEAGASFEDLHRPVASWHTPTVAALAIAGLLALAALRRSQGHQPPLVTVLCLSATYLAAAVCLAWLVQVGPHTTQSPLTALVCLVPFAFLVSTVDVTRAVMATALTERARTATPRPGVASTSAIDPVPPRRASLQGVLAWSEQVLHRVSRWPVAALALALPVWGVLTAVLLLLGQRPDSAVRAFLDTSDWTLSTRQSPPMVQLDQHYLCTVAAGGHRRLVRPLRRGVRHGHDVVVNRQLCVANAFEDVLAERLPRTHRAVRGFYDRCGLPVARHVTTSWRADAVYLVMKPLEWVFLAVLYASDHHPEQRIARQYLPGAPARPR